MAYSIQRWEYDERKGCSLEGTPEIISRNYREGYGYRIEEMEFMGSDDHIHFYYLVKVAALGQPYRNITEANSWEEAEKMAISTIEKEIKQKSRPVKVKFIHKARVNLKEFNRIVAENRKWLPQKTKKGAYQ